MSTESSVTASSGIFALVCMIAVIITGFAYYLIATEQALDYQADALAPVWYMAKPQAVILAISNGGYAGTLVAVLLNVFHSGLLAIGTFFLVSLFFERRATPRTNETGKLSTEKKLANGECECEIKGSEVMIMINGAKDQRSGKTTDVIIDKKPYRQVFFRLERAVLIHKRPAKTNIEKLYAALHSILAAHPDVPASVGAHHADTSLLNHSLAISKEMAKNMANQTPAEPFARVVGLAHDMDKLLAYTRKGDSWAKVKDCTHHNTYSAYIVMNQPEFAALSIDEQRTLILTLRYYHHPAMLPTDCGPRTERLITALRQADGFVTKNEKTNGIAQARAGERTAEILEKAITDTINGLNINGYHDAGLAGGWTKDAVEYVIIPMSTILENIGAHLPIELSRQLQVTVETRTFKHPAIDVILETLEEMALLLHEHKEIVSERGLFDVKIGVKNFSACVLLSKNRLEELLPTTVIKWGMSRFAMRIRQASQDITETEE